MKRFAFTMLEMIFVIIVIGIVTVLAMPSFHSNQLQQAAEQVAEHIRYTQHLAMVDDKFDPADPRWYEKRWQIRFPKTTISGEKIFYYEIFSDEDKEGNSDANEEAIDPLTQAVLGNGSDAINTIPEKSIVNLTKQYGIVDRGGSCNALSGAAFRPISFDNLGRPYEGVYVGAYSNQVPTGGCTIEIKHESEGNATITIHPQTGYVTVSY
jgi:type II secretory pathway pseudopilin PulG